jgi:hypothetical protein
MTVYDAGGADDDSWAADVSPPRTAFAWSYIPIMIIVSLALMKHSAHSGFSWGWVQWVFSGIGVAVIGWIGTWLFRKRQSADPGVIQSIKSSPSSVIIQTAGDLTIGKPGASAAEPHSGAGDPP